MNVFDIWKTNSIENNLNVFWIYFDVFDNDNKFEIFDFIDKKFIFVDVQKKFNDIKFIQNFANVFDIIFFVIVIN